MSFADVIALACVMFILTIPLLGIAITLTSFRPDRRSEQDQASGIDEHWETNRQLFGWDQ